ncbi:hypothetical protein DFP72DRAFT_844495 [Ephemerocybe angulata]|uniref:Uncharacterized protein n=1 Tax=Ephemerocybe angulata TaxID=980116 RepID=A0A8H6MCN5_9AGAR|nr:hypothetical protein DFP72DRAFT_844495 [Tulosesus angulatus]
MLRMTTTMGSTRQFNHSMANAFDSPAPSHCPEPLAQPPAQCHNAASQSEVATGARNGRARFWNKNGPQLPTSSSSTEFRQQVRSRRTQLAHVPTLVPRPSRHRSSMDPCDTSSFIVPQWVDYAKNRYMPDINGVLGNESTGWDSLKDRTMVRTSLPMAIYTSLTSPAVYTTSGPTSASQRMARTHPEHQQAALESSASKPSPSVPQDCRFDTPAASSGFEMPWRAWDGSGTITTMYSLTAVHTYRRSRGLGGVGA